jgi:hypothetical protein
LIDDYGHHPVEMNAILAAARGAYPKRRLVLAFQPHQNQYFCKEERNKLISRSSQKMPNNFSNDMNRNQYRNDNSYACPNCVLFFYLVFHF